jgi:thiol-disulfide isomerase/thioredoxin
MSEHTKEKWTVKRVLKEIATTLVIFFLISTTLNYLRQPNITENIYDYELLDMKENKIHFYEYEGEPLVVHFWGTWCPTCRIETSNIESISKDYNLISIAVNSGENSDIEGFMKKNELTFRVVNDSNSALADKFNIEAYPTTLIFNSKGELKFTELGYSTTMGLKARLEIIK